MRKGLSLHFVNYTSYRKMFQIMFLIFMRFVFYVTCQFFLYAEQFRKELRISDGLPALFHWQY